MNRYSTFTTLKYWRDRIHLTEARVLYVRQGIFTLFGSPSATSHSDILPVLFHEVLFTYSRRF